MHMQMYMYVCRWCMYLSIYLSAFLYVSACMYISIYLKIHPYIHVSIHAINQHSNQSEDAKLIMKRSKEEPVVATSL